MSSALIQRTQLAFEAVKGTPVPANKRLRSVSFSPFMPAMEFYRHRPTGSKLAANNILNKEWAASSIEGVPDFNEIGYLLSMVLDDATSAQLLDAAIQTTAYRHIFDFDTYNASAVKAATVEQGNNAYTQRIPFVMLNEFGLNLSRSEATIEGAALGRRIEDGVTLTAGPTEAVDAPFQPAKIDVYLDTTFGGLGTTKIPDYLAVSFSLGDRFSPTWYLNSAQASFTDYVESEPTVEATLTVSNNANGRTWLTRARAGATTFLRFEARGNNIYTNGAIVHDHRFRLDLAVQVADAFDEGDEEGLATLEIPLSVVHNPTWGKGISAELINTIAAY